MRTPEEIFYAAGLIEPYKRRFVREVWSNGLQQQADAATVRGLRAQLGQITVLTYWIAGRLLVTISRGEVWVSFVGIDVDSSGQSVGLQQWGGTPEEAARLADDLTERWVAEAPELAPAPGVGFDLGS